MTKGELVIDVSSLNGWLTVICRFDWKPASARSPHDSSIDLQLKNVCDDERTFGDVVSETLLLEARPHALRVPGLDPGDVGLEFEFEVEL